jgi:hypothetical protein
MMFALSILMPLLVGILAFHFFFKGASTIYSRFLFNLSLPIGIGISTAFFISLNLIGIPYWIIFILETGLLIFLILRYKREQSRTGKKINYTFDKFNSATSISNIVLLLAAVLYLYSWITDVGIFYFNSVQSPHGLWDAWSCWNLIAKFISRAPDNWPQMLHQMNAIDFHPDYPLLQRGFIAKSWLLSANESVWIPIASAFIFTFCTIGLLSSSVNLFNTKTEGLIAGLILLCTPFFMVMGHSQYADNTVGYFYLATVVLLTLARRGATIKPNLFIAAGLTAGMAAWSKNEGLLFIVCLFASQSIRIFFQDRISLMNELKYVLLGMLPFLLLIAYQKLIIAPPNQIISAQGSETFSKLTDFSRYEIVWHWFVKQFSTFGKWAINPWWLFLAGILFKGINIKENNYSFVSNFTLFFSMLTGFFFVEIVTPLGLVYYLSTSVHRLFFQLFPTFIFIYFLAINGKSGSQYNLSEYILKKAKK